MSAEPCRSPSGFFSHCGDQQVCFRAALTPRHHKLAKASLIVPSRTTTHCVTAVCNL